MFIGPFAICSIASLRLNCGGGRNLINQSGKAHPELTILIASMCAFAGVVAFCQFIGRPLPQNRQTMAESTSRDDPGAAGHVPTSGRYYRNNQLVDNHARPAPADTDQPAADRPPDAALNAEKVSPAAMADPSAQALAGEGSGLAPQPLLPVDLGSPTLTAPAAQGGVKADGESVVSPESAAAAGEPVRLSMAPGGILHPGLKFGPASQPEGAPSASGGTSVGAESSAPGSAQGSAGMVGGKSGHAAQNSPLYPSQAPASSMDGVPAPTNHESDKNSAAALVGPSLVPQGLNTVAGSRFARLASARGGLPAPTNDALYAVVMRNYGATFVARPGLKLPEQALFDKPAQVRAYQKSLPLKQARMGAYRVTLQEDALEALLAARKDAEQLHLKISPVGDIASLRTYEDTERIWRKYLEKGLGYWVGRKKMTAAEAAAILASPPRKQLNTVLALEQKGYYLHANRMHSLLNLAAPPGGSQHISGLALDVEEHKNPKVRAILNRHGFYQTVLHDTPHFIYLGRSEKELPDLGLTLVVSDGRQFWVPDIPPVETIISAK